MSATVIKYTKYKKQWNQIDINRKWELFQRKSKLLHIDLKTKKSTVILFALPSLIIPNKNWIKEVNRVEFELMLTITLN